MHYERENMNLKIEILIYLILHQIGHNIKKKEIIYEKKCWFVLHMTSI